MDGHDHCDHDSTECTYDALVGEYREAVTERDRLRTLVQAAREWSEAHKVWMDQARREGVRPTDEVSHRRAATAATMLDLVDHLDPPDGHGGATIELLAAMYGCVRDFIVEHARLRAVVEQALSLGEDEGMQRGKTPYPDWWILLDRALDSRRQLDESGEVADG